ncbi:MAG: hypothetical protein LBT59_15305 [Clostridiales bacterium]|jgi:hypothetical protein|nr:hypothetical protein [Clostridiales bacterium]
MKKFLKVLAYLIVGFIYFAYSFGDKLNTIIIFAYDNSQLGIVLPKDVILKVTEFMAKGLNFFYSFSPVIGDEWLTQFVIASYIATILLVVAILVLKARTGNRVASVNLSILFGFFSIPIVTWTLYAIFYIIKFILFISIKIMGFFIDIYLWIISLFLSITSLVYMAILISIALIVLISIIVTIIRKKAYIWVLVIGLIAGLLFWLNKTDVASFLVSIFVENVLPYIVIAAEWLLMVAVAVVKFFGLLLTAIVITVLVGSIIGFTGYLFLGSFQGAIGAGRSRSDAIDFSAGVGLAWSVILTGAVSVPELGRQLIDSEGLIAPVLIKIYDVIIPDSSLGFFSLVYSEYGFVDDFLVLLLLLLIGIVSIVIGTRWIPEKRWPIIVQAALFIFAKALILQLIWFILVSTMVYLRSSGENSD